MSAHLCVSGSVSTSELSPHVLGEGAGLQAILPSGSPTRLGPWLSLGGMCDLLVSSHLHVLHISVGLIIYFELAKTRTLTRLPTKHDYVLITPSI